MTLWRRVVRGDGAESAVVIGGLALVAYLLAPLSVVPGALVAFVAAAAVVPLAGPLAVVLAVPFSPLTRAFGPWQISPLEALLGCAIGGWLLGQGWRLVARRSGEAGSRADRRDDRPWMVLLGADSAVPNPVLRALTIGAVALLLCGALSLVVSAHLRESLRVFRLVVVEPVACYGLLVASLAAFGDRPRGVRWVLTAIVIASAAIAIIGIVHYLTGTNLITAEGVMRIRGYYGSPNNLGLYLDRTLPLTVSLAVGGGRVRPGYAAAAALQAVALLLTFSFGAWLAIAAALVLLAAFHGRRALLVTVGAFVIATMIAAPIASDVERIRSRFNFAEGTTFLRVQVWQAALAMAGDHPITGIGLDNFLYYYRDEGYMLPAAWPEPNLSHPHNVLLDVWLSLGVAGVVTAGWLGFHLVRGIGEARRRRTTKIDRAAIEGIGAGLAAGLIHGLVDNSYFLPDLAMLFWISCAIVGVLAVPLPRQPVGPASEEEIPA